MPIAHFSKVQLSCIGTLCAIFRSPQSHTNSDIFFSVNEQFAKTLQPVAAMSWH